MFRNRYKLDNEYAMSGIESSSSVSPAKSGTKQKPMDESSHLKEIQNATHSTNLANHANNL